MPMPKDKVRLVTTVGNELAVAIRAAVEEAGISEAMLVRLALSEYLEVPLTEADQRVLSPRRRARPIDRAVLIKAKAERKTQRDREANDMLRRLRAERGIA